MLTDVEPVALPLEVPEEEIVEDLLILNEVDIVEVTVALFDVEREVLAVEL